MSAYQILKLVHVVLAIIAVGTNLTHGIWISRAAREPRHLLTSLFLYACVVVLGLLGYTPVLRRQIAMLEASGPDTPEYLMLAVRGRRLGVMIAVLVLGIVFLMVTKPALWT